MWGIKQKATNKQGKQEKSAVDRMLFTSREERQREAERGNGLKYMVTRRLDFQW